MDKPEEKRLVMALSLIENYFTLTPKQKEQLEKFSEVFLEKNTVLNLVSRKDAENLEERHLLHSISISKYYDLSGAKVLDVGTGGGFPGIPLAIMFPDASFHLIDARRKKTDAVNEFVEALGLTNVRVSHIRAEELPGHYDFIVSRAVTSLDKFTSWTGKLIRPGAHKGQHRGIIYLRGMDFDFDTINDEISPQFDCNRIIDLHQFLNLDFFSSKKIVFLQRL